MLSAISRGFCREQRLKASAYVSHRRLFSDSATTCALLKLSRKLETPFDALNAEDIKNDALLTDLCFTKSLGGRRNFKRPVTICL